jgi:hypothetical protein
MRRRPNGRLLCYNILQLYNKRNIGIPIYKPEICIDVGIKNHNSNRRVFILRKEYNGP